MKKNKRTLFFSLLALAAILVTAVVVKNKNSPKGEPVQTEQAAKRTIRETVKASGKVFPKTEVKISSDVSGEIVELFVREGDSVRSGQVLARVDPEAYDSQVERAQAGVNGAKASLANALSQVESAKAQVEQVQAQLTNARDIHRRNERLFQEGVISEQEFESSQTNVRSLESNLNASEANVRSAQQSARSAEFQIKSAEATLKELSTSLKRTTIYASMGGIISKLNVEKGERVVGTSMMAGTEILRIADLQEMEVQVEVTENDLPRISLGQSVDIDIDAYLNRVFKGTVVEIAHTANIATGGTAAGVVNLTTDQVTNFVITIDIDPASYQDLILPGKPFPFRPGMSAAVEIYTQTAESVVCIPIQAVGTRDKSDVVGEQDDREGIRSSVRDDVQEIVFVYTDADTVDLRAVTTGIQDNDFIHILEGLSEGETVVTGPYAAVSKDLKEGDRVYRSEKKEKSSETEEKEED